MNEKKPRPISEILLELQGTESQEAFAARLGISQSLLSRMIRLNYLPKPSTIKRIVANLGIENDPLGRELMAYASQRERARLKTTAPPSHIAREMVQGLGAGIINVLEGIARYYERYLETFLEKAPVPEITLGGEELLVLAPIQTAVEPPFSFQWVHNLFYYDSLGEPRREEPLFYSLIVKCGEEQWRKDIPATAARRRYSVYLGKEEDIISVHSTEPEFNFEELPAGSVCRWEVQAFSSREELMGSSGEIRFKIFDPSTAKLSELDYFLLGLLFESAERFDDAVRMLQKIPDARQRDLALLGMFERRLEHLEKEIEQLESEGGDEEVNRLKKEREHLFSMVNLYRAKVREALKGG